MNHYTLIFAGRMSDAIDKLPNFTDRKAAAATGTDGKNRIADEIIPQAKTCRKACSNSEEKSRF